MVQLKIKIMGHPAKQIQTFLHITNEKISICSDTISDYILEHFNNNYCDDQNIEREFEIETPRNEKKCLIFIKYELHYCDYKTEFYANGNILKSIKMFEKNTPHIPININYNWTEVDDTYIIRNLNKESLSLFEVLGKNLNPANNRI